MRPFPNTAEELLQELERIAPELTVNPGDTTDHVMYNAGRRSLVKELRAWQAAAVAPALREKRGQGRVVRKAR